MKNINRAIALGAVLSAWYVLSNVLNKYSDDLYSTESYLLSAVVEKLEALSNEMEGEIEN